MKNSKLLFFKDFHVIFLLFGSFAVGLFNEPAGAVCNIILGIWLIIKAIKNREIKIPFCLTTLAVFCISSGFLVTAFWGVDKYYSLLGFVKFLPLLLYWLVLFQDDIDKDYILDFIPVSGVIMTVVSYVLSHINVLKDYFSVDSRISGFFQYPNTFALFLIIGLIILSTKKELKFFSVFGMAVHVFGIFMTGSRSSFIIFCFAFLGILFIAENKRVKQTILVSAGIMIVAAGIYFAITGKHGAIGRFLTISFKAGTLTGRLIYFKDAVKFILSHPFGIGYMGYYFAQGSFQTAVYSNTFVHNELLQLFVDIGWIPAILLLTCFIKAIFNKEMSKKNRLILLVAAAHSMLDFDFQFLIVDFILLICVSGSVKNFKTFSIKKTVIKNSLVVSLCFVIIISLYLGTSSLLYLLSKSEAATHICKYNTMAQIDTLYENEDYDEINKKADIIISNNKYISNAYSAKAIYYFSQNDIEKTIEYKTTALKYGKYFYDEYYDYAVMLINVTSTYLENGDYDSATYCFEKLEQLKADLEHVKATTDKKAYSLPDKPRLDLPKECNQAIEEYEKIFN